MKDMVGLLESVCRGEKTALEKKREEERKKEDVSTDVIHAAIV